MTLSNRKVLKVEGETHQASITYPHPDVPICVGWQEERYRSG